VWKGTGGWKKIVKAFGNDILLENGEIDRPRLGQIVFSDPAKRQLLNRYGFTKLEDFIFWCLFYECSFFSQLLLDTTH
jgi:dephospho-CoA kinase